MDTARAAWRSGVIFLVPVLAAGAAGPGGPATGQVLSGIGDAPHCRLRPVAMGAVRMGDGFWSARMRTNVSVTIPHALEMMEQRGYLENFRIAAGTATGEHQGYVFNDSDLYKWLEGACLAIGHAPDAAVGREVERIVGLIAGAQAADGYLNTAYQIGGRPRYTNLAQDHELYCAGHLIEAAVAHHRATGSDRLLEVATRLADHLDGVFGPGRKAGAPGHPEIETALVELYRDTGERRYLDLARYFVDVRGSKPGVAGGTDYLQDHKPFRELDTLVGHAVRALYLCAGATDLHAELGDDTLLAALRRLAGDVTAGKRYITAGLGSRHRGESFGDAFELPNYRAYSETCAAVAYIRWNWRMLAVEADARYADLMEAGLYNAFLSGVSLEGRDFFYTNPLESRGSHTRRPWYRCACCPPNIIRTIASVPGLMYATDDTGLYLHLYDASEVDTRLPGGQRVRLAVETRYPWDGAVLMTIGRGAAGRYAVCPRIPGWCRRPGVRVQGKPVTEGVTSGSYLRIERAWQPGDRIELELPMEAEPMMARREVRDNTGRVAIRRGPVVYCLEGPDHPGFDVLDAALVLNAASPGRSLRPRFEPGLLGGVVVLDGQGVVPATTSDTAELYRPIRAEDLAVRQVALHAIPYYAWANRGASHMVVWIPRRVARPDRP